MRVDLVSVFPAGPDGGNPAPTVADAGGMSDAAMQAVARFYGHESGFVLPAPDGSDVDFVFRFWVPNHEMSMCGHATVGAVWLLDRLGRLPRDRVLISTSSGRVEARVIGRDGNGGARIEISQPAGETVALQDEAVMEDDILAVLGITAADRAPLPVRNAATSRVKTLVPMRSVAALDALRPDFAHIEAVCERIGSTGLYPFAVADVGSRLFHARQFPKSSGYPEDAATGIAAAALAYGLLEYGLVAADGGAVTVRQGQAMGRPSEIVVRFDPAGGGCWLGGGAELVETADVPVS